MAKKKATKSVRKIYRKAKRRFRKDSRFPISTAVGLGTSILAPPIPGWSTAWDEIREGHLDKAFQSFIANWTGIQIGGIGGQVATEFNFRSLNPFDMNFAPAWKSAFWTHLISMVIKKFVGDPFRRIPVVGKYVKFS